MGTTRPVGRGLLVAFEGIDGVGKTTQLGLLFEHLRSRGVEVVRSKEPTEGPWGRRLRASAQLGRLPPEEELQAFLEDRREHVRELIEPALARGAVVLLDRYYFSTAAYQGARGMNPQALLAQNEAFAPRPDLLVLLELSPRAALERIKVRGEGDNEFEREENLQRTAAVFATLQGDYVLRLDAGLSREELARRLAAALDARLGA